MSLGNPALLPFLPLLEQRAKEMRTQVKRGARIALPIIAGTVVVGIIYVWVKKRGMEKELAKIATDINVRNAAMYIEAVKPPGLLMKIISMSPAGLVLDAADTVRGWFGMSVLDQVLAITDRVVDWDATVVSYRKCTGGRSLNRDIKKKLGADYPKFVDRLANNTRAVDIKTRQDKTRIATESEKAKDRAIIMRYPPGTIKVYPKPPYQPQIRDWSVATSKDKVQFYSEPGHKKVAKADKAGTYVGKPSGRLMNYGNRNAMVEVVTSNGNAWAELNDLAIYVPTS